jgi:predicted CoA-substrate-specific enzyme activase
MISAGIDVGALWTKALVLEDGETAGFAMLPTWESGVRVAEDTLRKALEPLHATPGDLHAVVATGAGKQEVGFARESVTEVVCAARGIRRLEPEARGVLDLGAESSRAVKLDERGDVLEYALNDKCASGTGIFLDAIAKVMGLDVEQMGPLSLQSDRAVEITNTCVVFAESEVVSQVARQTPKQDIVKGIHMAIASRVHGTANRVGLSTGVAVIGGLARNVGIVACLEELMGGTLTIPPEPHRVSALGAALVAEGGDGA